MANKRLKFLILSALLSGTFLLYYLNGNQLSTQMIYYINVKNENNNFAAVFENKVENIRLKDARTWTINNLIAQYSSKIIKHNSNNKLIVEALVFYNHKNQSSEYIKSNVKFLIRCGTNNEQLFVKVKDLVGKETNIVAAENSLRYLWKLRGEFEATLSCPNVADLDKIVFLLTDMVEYGKMSTIYREDDVSRILVFQKPDVYDSGSRKKAAIAHCVHTVRDLNIRNKLDQMKTWLRIQKILGIDRVKLYFIRVEQKDENVIRSLNLSSNTPIIEIVDFRLVDIYYGFKFV
jgi:hypothetical protein